MTKPPLIAPMGLLVLWAMFPAGLNAEEPASSATGQDDTPTLQDVQQEWSELLEQLKGYSSAQRDEALTRARRALDAMDEQIEQLQARADREWDQLGDTARERRRAALQSLQVQRQRLAEWYGGMKHSSAGAWNEVRRGFIDAYGRLDEAFGRAADAFGSEQNGTQ